MSRTWLVLLFLAALSMPFAAAPSVSAIYRCRTSDGASSFSDRPCHRQGLRADLPGRPGRQSVPSPGWGIGCPARTPEALLGALRVAIGSGDANHVAGLYDWRGVSQGGALPLWLRLRQVARRGSIEIAFELPEAGHFDYVDPVMVEMSLPVDWSSARVRVDHYAYADGGPIVSEYFSLSGGRDCYWLKF